MAGANIVDGQRSNILVVSIFYCLLLDHMSAQYVTKPADATRRFDHNWKLSIPPPFVNKTLSTYVWEGLDNAAWGSHLYLSYQSRVCIRIEPLRAC